MLQKLETRRWVSLSLEISAQSSCRNANTSPQPSHFDNSESPLEDVYGPDADLDDESDRPSTVFQAKMPGAMTVEEVEDQIDLGRWRLKLGDRLVNLEVG